MNYIQPLIADNTDISWSRRFLSDNGGGTSFADIDDLLDCIWIRRIWTFQEALLAHNPIVVCGQSHIGWDQLSLSIIFLREARSSRHLTSWAEVVALRAFSQDKIEGADTRSKQLKDYYQFSVTLAELTGASYGILVVAYMLSLLGCFVAFVARAIINHNTNEEYSKAFKLKVIFLLLFAFAALAFISHSINRLIPSGRLAPRAPKVRTETRALLNSNIYDRLVETLSTRQATNPRDMSFGLYPVLERCRQEETPLELIPNYGEPVDVVYRNLTVYVLEQTKSLEFLPLAATMSYPGAPSWVPDYSRSLSLRTIYSQRMYDMMKVSTPFWKVSSCDNTVLVVKGVSVDTISATSTFCCTSTACNTAEEHLHLRNIELFKRWRYDLSSFVSEAVLRETLKLIIPSVAAAKIPAYVSKLSIALITGLLRPRGQRSTETFALATKRILEDLTTSNLLPIFIGVTNALAQQNATLLDFATGWTGYCLGKVDKSDRVDLVSGVYHPLIMRNCGRNSRLVSTVFISDVSGRIPWSWEKQLQKLQAEAHQTSNGETPHPKDKPLHKSDPENKLEALLPDIRIC